MPNVFNREFKTSPTAAGHRKTSLCISQSTLFATGVIALSPQKRTQNPFIKSAFTHNPFIYPHEADKGSRREALLVSKGQAAFTKARH